MHGIKLKDVMYFLVEEYGWEYMGTHVEIRCFQNNQTIKSSLKFLREHQWARDQVEALYLKLKKD